MGGLCFSVGWPPCFSHQALDGDFSEDNRNKCRVATAPLIEAVENLTAFASNPEFVSIPAQISSEVGSRCSKGNRHLWLDLCGTDEHEQLRIPKPSLSLGRALLLSETKQAQS